MTKINIIFSIICVALIVIGYIGQIIFTKMRSEGTEDEGGNRRERQDYKDFQQEIDDMYEEYMTNNKQKEIDEIDNFFDINTEKK